MNTAAISADWVGRVIDGRFPLLKWLGGANSGGVFQTELVGLPWQKAAIKLILADGEDTEARIASWASATSLSHPHLVRLFHSGSCRVENLSLLYAVTEYSEEMLSQILPDRPLTSPEAKEMLGPVMDALSYLHAEGFVHGHLKPSNVLVIDDQVKLSSDCLHLAGNPVRHSRGPSIYYPPEAATEPISPAADVWLLGAILVETLTQHPPVWDRVAQSDPDVPQFLPQPYLEIAQQCLRSDPARRCTLSDIRTRLQLPQPRPIATAETEKASPAWYRRPLIIAAIFFVVASSATFLLRSHHTQPSPPTDSQPSVVASPEPTTQSPAPANPPSPAPANPQSQAPVNPPSPAPVEPQSQAPANPPTPTPAPANRPSSSAALNGAVVDQVMPDVLPRATASIHGQVSVKVRVTVDSAGNVSDATLDSPGPSKYFADAALKAAQRWKFKPAPAEGAAVPSAWILHFKFQRTGTEVTPVPATQ